MHNLEQWIADWRKSAMAAPNICDEMLDELESHLRDTVDSLVRSGLGETEAFQIAVAQLGSTPVIASEFRKLEHSLWLPVKVIACVGVMAALLLATVLVRSGKLQSDALLASHIYLLTLGYMTVFFSGMLGICFVCQGSFSEFSPSRSQSIRRANAFFCSLALVLTSVGMILGVFWAKGEWGRYWAWDLRETGALCVVLWLSSYLFLHRFVNSNSRTFLAVSVLGNNIVGLAWFGPPLLTHLHQYGASNNLLFVLVGAFVANVILFLLSFASPGWLRLSKA
ncbi:MAG: cytochrome c biogenesis protein CcsA [Verrucomicrobiales bacterium]